MFLDTMLAAYFLSALPQAVQSSVSHDKNRVNKQQHRTGARQITFMPWFLLYKNSTGGGGGGGGGGLATQLEGGGGGGG